MYFKDYWKWLLVLVLLLFACLVLSATESKAEEPLSEYEVANIIYWLAIDYGKGTTKNTVVNDRDEFAVAFIGASKTFKIPLFMLLSIAQRESNLTKRVFELRQLGKNKEKGVMQTNDDAIDHCIEYCGDMKTAKEQIYCGGCWFRYGQDWCKGNVYTGLSAYINGKCNPTTNNHYEKINRRFTLWGKLNRLVRVGIPIPPDEKEEVFISQSEEDCSTTLDN